MKHCFLLVSLSVVVAVDGLVAPSTKTVVHRTRKLTPLHASTSSRDDFVRISPRTARGNRQIFELQTAVTTLERKLPSGATQRLDLHAQIHFGSQEYFNYYNNALDNGSSVFYELLVDDDLLEYRDGSRSIRPSKDGTKLLMASPGDRQMAQQYGLTCQVDQIDYGKPNWKHADLTRQEFLALVSTREQDVQQQQPLWALASTAPTWLGEEAFSAIFRPLTPATSLSPAFSNFGIPGSSSLAMFFRLLSWFLVPSPELSVMVLDWSIRPTGGVSKILMPVMESLLTGNIQEARQLVFGQVLVSGQKNDGADALLIHKRNEHAMDVVMTALDTEKIHSAALLYGAMHCSGLTRKLRSKGFAVKKTSWRTAWSVRVPSFSTAVTGGLLSSFPSVASPNAIAVGLVILPGYLLIGGLDWIATWQELFQNINALDAGATVVLYLFRHVVMYLALSKFVLEWDSGKGLFGSEK